MMEQQIRDTLAYINAVKERWDKEAESCIVGDWLQIDIDEDEGGLEFLWQGYSDTERTTVPWLAFTDFDAALSEFKRQKAERDAAWARDKERRDRAQYEALRQKYGEVASK